MAFLKNLRGKIRAYFIAGLLTVVPLSFTLYVISLLLKHGDRIFNLIPQRFNPRTYLPFPIPGLGIALVVLVVLMIGVLVKNYVGGRIVEFGERIVYQIPLVRPIYTAVKQLLIAIFSQSDDTFKRVVLIEYPRRGVYAIAFVTGVPNGEVQSFHSERMINVFLPTTPNPTSGFYLLVPEKETIPLAMSVEEAFKLLISGGLVSPPEGPAGNHEKGCRPSRLSSYGRDHSNDSKHS
ncbi:Uncharacterized membrane protein [Desulfacinum hydrothermale DSM 13146]|uniref:Uncharacterized membrane protein n=1 Tax=Desulfacinum hydrothermale DSM 13146 TaxID=1121390 RepID=A0A1W1XK07_9BACT|nr:DUF502 domain-containing protein [Desulfacinum hydrothermale]SMC24265.1 Uncharacterized membrane protein [Desulfacinum hydrothermale DSM 13146]